MEGKQVNEIVKNIQHIVGCLERSLIKSKQFENQYLTKNSLVCNLLCQEEQNEMEKETTLKERDKLYANSLEAGRVEATGSESWSTMSIVCLQYQYEELTNNYQNLLQTLNQRSKELSEKDLEKADRDLQIEELTKNFLEINNTLDKVCTKYLDLKHRKHKQKDYYESKIEKSTRLIEILFKQLHTSRKEQEELISGKLYHENDTKNALLLSEIRRSNRLFQENLLLKEKLYKLCPEQANCLSSSSEIKK